MTSTTTNLGLTTYNNTTDQSGSFITWVRVMSGSAGSNMVKIDNFSGSVSGSIAALDGPISGSISVLTSQMTGLSGSITEIDANITALGLRLIKLSEFTGAGTADFTSISQSYTHLMIIGTAAINYAASNVDVGCDFNGDANGANYNSVQWQKDATWELLSEYPNYGAAWLANVPGSMYSGYGAPIFAIIPNYSSSGGFYKNAMGVNVFQSPGGARSMIQGGYWLSTEAITRVRIFGIYGSAARRSFLAGTVISLYGIG